jgi:hypothetical protein
MRRAIAFPAVLAFVFTLAAQTSQPNSGAAGGTESLQAVKRIYVGHLTGGAEAEALRELIIASLDSTKLFILTDKEERADAVLKGAANDKAFTDTFDNYEGSSGHTSMGKSAGGSSLTSKVSGLFSGTALGENDSYHSRERKHEAYASVRLCNKDGDVLWSTTQESVGAKFRSAGADVAAKVAHQIALDYNLARRTEAPAAVVKR